MSVVKMMSQTSLKHFEEGCKRKWWGMWVSKEIPFYSNHHMDRGKYFEQLALPSGESAVADDIVTELPTKKNGDKYAHTIRIENQAAKFRRLFDPFDDAFLGFEIVKDQRELWSPNKRDRGTLDFDCKHIETAIPSIWDLKLTGDATAIRHPKHWGHPDDHLDVTQAVWYADLWEQNFGFRPEFNYLIFDYTPRENVKFVNVVVTDEAIDDLNRRKDSLLEEVEVLEKEGYPEIPSKYECMSCPFECKSRVEPFNVE